jgi:hypothetical protein
MTDFNNFFDAFGVNANDVDENPFSIPKNVYDVVLADAGTKEFNGIKYFVLEWHVATGPHAGKNASDMHRMQPWTPQERDDWEAMNVRTLSSFKKALMDLGMNAAQIGQFNPNTMGNKLVGIKGTASMGPQKNRPEYNSITNFSRKVTASPATNSAGAPVSGNGGLTGGPVAEENIADLLGDWSK